jgi:ATP/maltotriose-dependent transcriptional regulator MalT
VKTILEDNGLLNTTLIQGGLKSQKDVDNFFHNQDAKLRQKQKECTERRHKKGPTPLNKTDAEIKQLAQQAKQERLAEKQKRKEALAKEAEKWASAKNAALRLHKKVYKSLLYDKRKKGKTVERQQEQELLGELKNFTHEIDDNVEEETQGFDEMVLEISKLRYHEPVMKNPKGTRIEDLE